MYVCNTFVPDLLYIDAWVYSNCLLFSSSLSKEQVWLPADAGADRRLHLQAVVLCVSSRIESPVAGPTLSSKAKPLAHLPPPLPKGWSLTLLSAQGLWRLPQSY